MNVGKQMIEIDNYIKSFSATFKELSNLQPWDITKNLIDILNNIISKLDENYEIKDGIAIHKTATIEKGAILKAPVIVSQNCFIGANAYLRAGVYIASNCSIGPGCEIKTSIIFKHTHMAHFNFIGDSIIGSNVNFEAGAITANTYNERINKEIDVLVNSKIIHSGSIKFGSFIGDDCKIGANAVLSPGTILLPNSIVKRLELIEQIKEV